MFQNILNSFGLDPGNCRIKLYGSGLINHTWKISSADHEYVLQRINNNVFKNPEHIDENLALIKKFLTKTAPEYLFAAPIETLDQKTIVISDGEYYRLLPFIKKSHTINNVKNANQAYHAAKQFGKFTRLLNNFDSGKLSYTLPDFHNLSLRIEQFHVALQCENKRFIHAKAEVKEIILHMFIAERYAQLKSEMEIPLRVIHHDTKINNVLLDDHDEGLCVIDLDTVMPGYFISDVGDMMRTYLSEANEEEVDVKKISIREEIFTSIYKGYMEEMDGILTEKEKDLFIYSGKFMIYMQAVRFLTDFLNGDVYYKAAYPMHNLSRAQNQLTLLKQYINAEQRFVKIMHNLEIKVN